MAAMGHQPPAGAGERAVAVHLHRPRAAGGHRSRGLGRSRSGFVPALAAASALSGAAEPAGGAADEHRRDRLAGAALELNTADEMAVEVVYALSAQQVVFAIN